eukprot:143682-Prorocentrum_lima.AAC.1
MTSSLVGSEMCIRDSFGDNRSRRRESAAAGVARPRPTGNVEHDLPAVSYTHLTLPTSVDLGGR